MLCFVRLADGGLAEDGPVQGGDAPAPQPPLLTSAMRVPTEACLVPVTTPLVSAGLANPNPNANPSPSPNPSPNPNPNPSPNPKP